MTFLQIFWALLRRLFKKGNDVDLTKASYASLIQVDKVLYAKTISLAPTNALGTYNLDTRTPIVTGKQGMVVVGVYSYDGGVSWNSFNTTARVISTLSVQVQCVYNFGSDAIQYSILVNATVGGGTTVPLTVKVALVQGQDTDTNVEEPPTPLYEQKTVFDSRTSIPRIAKTLTARTTSTQTVTLPHGFTTAPDVFAYVYDETNGVMYSNGRFDTTLRVDDTNVTISSAGTTIWNYYINVYYP